MSEEPVEIWVYTKRYELPDDQKAALDRLLYEQQAGILKAIEVTRKAKKFLEDAATCRGTGLLNLEDRIANILKYFRLYNQEHLKGEIQTTHTNVKVTRRAKRN